MAYFMKEFSSISSLITSGDHVKLKKLLNEGARVDIANRCDLRPIHEAAIAAPRGIECLKELLKHGGSDINWQTINEHTALLILCKSSCFFKHKDDLYEAVDLMLQYSADPNIPDHYGKTPLYEAADDVGNLRVVQILIKAGADPSLATIVGVTPLHMAAKQGDIQLFQCLLKANSKIDAKDAEKRTPLLYAAVNSRFDVVSFILEEVNRQGGIEGINICAQNFCNALTIYCETFLLLSKEGCRYCIQQLIKYGSDPNTWHPEDNIKALNLAVMMEDFYCLRVLFNELGLLPLIMQYDPVVLEKDLILQSAVLSECPIHAALDFISFKTIVQGEKMIETLLQAGFSSNSIWKLPEYVSNLIIVPRGVTHESAFSYSVYRDTPKVLNILIAAGANPNIPTEFCLHPLIRAVWTNDEHILNHLLQLGSDINYCPEIFLMAIRYKHLVQQILDSGCNPMLCFEDSYFVQKFVDAVITHADQRKIVQLLTLILQYVVITDKVQQAINSCILEAQSTRKYCTRTWCNIIKVSGNPSSLMHMCRINLRQQMYAVHGSAFISHVNGLPLTQSLTKYLLFN